jgi:hypothetical protein
MPHSIRLRRDWLAGRLAWEVLQDSTFVGHVLKDSMGQEWGAVPAEQDPYDQIEYWYRSRRDALAALLRRSSP